MTQSQAQKAPLDDFLIVENGVRDYGVPWLPSVQALKEYQTQLDSARKKLVPGTT